MRILQAGSWIFLASFIAAIPSAMSANPTQSRCALLMSRYQLGGDFQANIPLYEDLSQNWPDEATLNELAARPEILDPNFLPPAWNELWVLPEVVVQMLMGAADVNRGAELLSVVRMVARAREMDPQNDRPTMRARVARIFIANLVTRTRTVKLPLAPGSHPRIYETVALNAWLEKEKFQLGSSLVDAAFTDPKQKPR